MQSLQALQTMLDNNKLKAVQWIDYPKMDYNYGPLIEPHFYPISYRMESFHNNKSESAIRPSWVLFDGTTLRRLKIVQTMT